MAAIVVAIDDFSENNADGVTCVTLTTWLNDVSEFTVESFNK